jgi:16S rRNA (guanine(966)-N(2))-methyltransferase RsmD
MVVDKINGGHVLDAFAGSGALGIEAFSRGATSVIFIEKSPKAAKIIRENLKTLNINAEVITGDAAKFETKETFDLILVDPPYDKFSTVALPNLAKYLDKNGIFVLSHPGDAPDITGVKLLDSHKYAGATISLYSANA